MACENTGGGGTPSNALVKTVPVNYTIDPSHILSCAFPTAFDKKGKRTPEIKSAFPLSDHAISCPF